MECMGEVTEMNVASLQLIKYEDRSENSLHKRIISSRVELEEYQETGERAIRWLKRYRFRTPQLTG